MKIYHCPNCRGMLFFDSLRCVGCHSDLSFDPIGDQFLLFGQAAGSLAACRNRNSVGCNAVADASGTGFCQSCNYNRMVPTWSEGGALHRNWAKLEAAKRLLIRQLSQLRALPPNRREDPQRGLGFDFLQQDGSGGKVRTGHADGIITIDLAEADAAHREATRVAMGERYRTLLGHFRHEVGHYVWMRWATDGEFLQRFGEVFGDGSRDYGEALKRYYREGAPPDWAQRFISPYATAHPWEDWAECFAHLLHLLSTLDSAFHLGLTFGAAEAAFFHEFPALQDPYLARPEAFPTLMESWYRLSCAVNVLNRSVGQPDLYPFVLNSTVAAKLEFLFREFHRR